MGLDQVQTANLARAIAEDRFITLIDHDLVVRRSFQAVSRVERKVAGQLLRSPDMRRYIMTPPSALADIASAVTVVYRLFLCSHPRCR